MIKETKFKSINYYLAACLLTLIILVPTPAHAGVNNWSVRPNPSTGSQINGVVYGDGIYLTAGNNQTIMSSLDASTWQLEVSASNYHLLDVIFGNNTFIAVGKNLMLSADGQNWDEVVFDPTSGLRSMAYGNNIYVGIGWYGVTAYSSDAVNWTYNPALANLPNLNAVTYGDGLFIAVGTGAGLSPVIYSSLDGITWYSETITPTPPTTPINDVTYGNGTFVAVGNANTMYTSSDGQDWIYDPLAIGENFQSIAFGDGNFVLAGARLYASQDAIDWRSVYSATSGTTIKRVRYTNNSFIAVGRYNSTGNGLILQSDSSMSSNASLSSITLSSGVLSPAFSPAITSYTVSAYSGLSSITLTQCSENTHASVTINAPGVQGPLECNTPSSSIALTVGSNVIHLVVTAQDGTVKTYTITVIRAAADPANADLGNLTVSHGILTPAFSSGTTSYTDSIANIISSMTVTPTVANAGATVTVNGLSVASGTASQGINLNTGNNTITIVVTSSSGAVTKTYTVLANRLASANADLSSVSVSQGTLSPVFASATTSYTESVADSVTGMTVTPTSADSGSTIRVNGAVVASGTASGNIPLAVGSNTINIAVTAQDNTTTKTYTITVTRAPSSNADLSSLTVSQGTLTPVFAAGTTSYTASVASIVAGMTVTPTAAGSGAVITVNGTGVASGTPSSAINLDLGNTTISIVVTAQDGTTIKTYTLTVTRAPSSNADLSGLTISQGSLSPAFAPDTTIYTNSVDNTVAGITVTPTTADPGAAITVNGTTTSGGTPSSVINLNAGNNTISIVITAQDGLTVKTYTITVNRAGSGNADLSSLTVDQGTLSPAFAAGTTSYTDSVANSVTNMTITPTAAGAGATITVNGSAVTSGVASQSINLNVGNNTIAVHVAAEDGLTEKTYTITVTRAPSTNADLSNLTVSQGTLTPAFTTGTTSYIDSVANIAAGMTVTPTVADATATITVNGTAVTSGSASQTINLNVGNNTVSIIVTAQDGSTTKSYDIIVNRAPSSNADLSSLTVSQGTLTPAFASGTMSYTDLVANSATSMTVTPTLADATATITVNGTAVAGGAASQAINLNVGNNTITLVVTAQDGSTTNTYTITVARALSSNADLSNLTVSQGTLSPAFAAGTTIYTDSVANSVTSMTVTPTLVDATGSITVNGMAVASGSASQTINLNVGSNTVTVVVTAQDGSTTNTYAITVSRASSNNTDLSSLTVSQGILTPAFAAGTTNYTDSVANSITSMTVTPTLADANGTITVNGMAVASGAASQAITLNIGSNPITVIVTAQDGSTTKTYTITVTRAGSGNADLSNLTVSQGTLAPAFAAATTSYTDSVINSVTGMTLTPSASDTNATIRVNGAIVASGTASANIPLTVGSNTINVVVTAQDGSTTKTYAITVTRAGSSNADLSNLTVSQGTLAPVFSAATTSYTDSVINSITGMTLTPSASDTNATIRVNGAIVASGTASANIPLTVGSNTINVVVTAQDGSTTNTYTIIVTRAPSSNADLSNLTVSQGTLAPAFAAATTSYTDSVINSVTSMTLTPSTSDTNATIRVNGTIVAGGTASANIPLTVGSNTITVVVTAQDGITTNTYTITVIRAGSGNADLSILTVSQGTLAPAFAATTTSYTDSVTNSVTSMTVTPTLADVTGTVTVNGMAVASGAASQAINLTVGSNIINVVVTAQDGSTTKTYTITVTRAPSINADLSNLTVSQGTLAPAFAAATTSYTDSVINSVTGMTVTPSASDTNATIRVNGTIVASGTASANISLAVGSNSINVVVTAQDGSTTRTYSITVTRAGSSNADLSNLTVSQGTLAPAFVAATTSYTDSVINSVTGMTVTPSASDANATIRVNGTIVAGGTASANIPLAVGSNTINVVVTAQDGSTIKTYTITVTRAPSSNADLSTLSVSQGALAPAFASNTMDYSNSVANSAATITVTPTAAGAGTSITVNGTAVTSGFASQAIDLNVGSNTITIVVTAQDGTTTNTYTITVTRASQALTNADLSDLTISLGTLTPVFASETINYTDSVAYTVLSLTVTPTSADTGATIIVNSTAVTSGSASQDISLNIGDNTIDVIVTAQDGITTKTYTITVNRAAASSNADLNNLMVSQGALTPAFASGTMSYTDSVANSAESMTVTPTAAGTGATITVNGVSVPSGSASQAIDLNVGSNIITVIVTAQDGITTNSYTITVTRELSNNADLSSLAVSQGTLSPAFAAATTSYTDSVVNGVTGMTLTPSASDTNATIRVNGAIVTSGTASADIPLTVGSNIINIVVTAQDGSTTKTYAITVTRAGSSNADLSNLAVSQGTLAPAFAAATTSYTDSVINSITGMTLTPSASDTNATIRVNGAIVASGTASANIPLAVGSNTINVVITAQDGSTTKTYTITVTRAASSNADLSSLAVSQGILAPAFSAATTSYTDSVINSTTGMTVTPSASDTNATIRVNGTIVASGTASANIPLAVGSNTINIVITAQDDSTTKTYTITVTRAPSSNADLSNLAVSQGSLTPAFASATTSYTDSVINSITGMTVTPSASDTNATIRVNGAIVAGGTASASIPLTVGSNSINVVVTAQDGSTTRTYTITVTRAPSSNADLSSLSVSQGTLTPAFATNTVIYSDSVANSVTGMTVTPTLADTNASITVNGTAVASGSASGAINLNVGNNTITVVITAQDGLTTKSYTITVNRAGSGNADLSSLSVSQGMLTPAFAAGTTSYSDSVANSISGMTVTPTAAGIGSTITVNGMAVVSGFASQSIPLNVGSNTITVVVTAQDEITTNTYTITVTRAGSGNADLSILTVSQGALTPAFAAATTSYTDSVTNSVTSMTVTPTLADVTGTVTVNGMAVASGAASQAINLTVGSNTINVVVTAQDGSTTKTYTITVTRAPSINADLSNLTVSQGTLAPAFAAATTSYTDSVINSVTGMTVTPSASDTNATIRVNGTIVASGTASANIPLAVGSNSINVVVTAQDGSTTRTYSITVTRAGSSNADLSNLTVSQGTLAPAFAAVTINYTDSVANNIAGMTVTPTAAGPGATITVNGTTVASGSASQTISLIVGFNTITVVVTAQDGSTTKTYTLIVNRAPSGNADLSSLTVSQGTLTPAFAAVTTSYNDSVPNSVSSMTVTPTLADATSTVTVNGSAVVSGSASQAINLNVGNNTITIVITAQNSLTNTYTITVNRAQSSNADLSNLTVSQGTLNPVFASGTTTYADPVINSATSMTVTPTVADATATITVNAMATASGAASQAINLNVGVNTITVVVTAQDGTTTRTYTITVTRAPSSNAALSSLTVSQGTLSPVFAAGTTIYTDSVTNSAASMTVTPTVADATAIITVNGTASASGAASQAINLNVGVNAITVVVTAQDGSTTRTYTITVTRAPSSNADLSSLLVSQGALTPVFASGTTSYTDTVTNSITSMTVTPTVADATSTITVNGTVTASGAASGAINLNVGNNTITVVVRAQDGSTTKTYTITVNRAGSSDADLSSLSVNHGTLSPAFSAAATGYTVSLANSYTSISVTATAAGPASTIRVNGSTVTSGIESGSIPLMVGNNTINVVVTAQDGLSTKTYTIIVTRAGSSNANLINLTLSQGTLSPFFASAVTSYTGSVANSVTSMSVTPTAAGSGATITVNGVAVTSGSASGPINLNLGNNVITIVVTAQDGITTMSYAITVNRAAAQSNNADLSSFFISQGTLTPAFSPATIIYSAGVDFSVPSLTVTPVASNTGATITVNGTAVASGSASGAINLSVGSNTISIVVTAQDTITQKTYSITVTRNAARVLPGLIEAENYTTMSGVALETCTDISGGLDITSLNSGDWMDFNVSAAATGLYTIQYRYQNTSTAAYQLQFRIGTTTLVTTSLPNATAWTTTAESTTFLLNAGTQTLRLYAGYAGTGLKVNSLQFNSSAVPNNPDLINITLSQGALNPSFASDLTNYTNNVTNSVSGITLTPTAVDAGSTIRVNGVIVASGAASSNIPLVVGSNTINVVVTARDGSTTKTYTVTVNRAAATSNNADLSNLTVSQGSLTPAFAPAAISYSGSVINSVTGMTVTPSAADTGATISVNGTVVAGGSPSANIPLSVGSNTINIVVTAQDGSTTKTYTVTVTRAAATSNNADLGNLTISQGALNPAFAAAVTSYTDAVANTITGMTVTPTAADTNATIRVNGAIVASGSASASIPLAVGSNTINIIVTAQDDSTTRTYTIIVTRAAVASNNADLSNLTVSQGSFTPAFTAATTSYADAVVNSVSGITVTPTAADVNATIRVGGTIVAGGSASASIPLAVGSNTINIAVTAPDGSTIKTYTITVTRAAAASNNADLSNLTVSQGTLTPAFAAATTSYTDSVLNSITGMTVTPSAADAGATIRVNGVINASGAVSANIPLAVGSNTINIVLTAQDGSTTRTYTITVTRAAAASNNADLSNLTVSQGTLTPAFAVATTSYTDSVVNSVTGMTVTPTAADTGATIRVNGTIVAGGTSSASIPLTVGSNTINVVVTAQDGSTTRTYAITVTRAAAASNNADLSNLTVSQGTLTPAFTSAITSYTDSVINSVTGMTLTPTASDINATIRVNGTIVASGAVSANIPLAVGSNTINIVVTAQDGSTTNTYTITVTRAISSNADLSNLTLSQGTLNPAFAAATTSYTDSVINSITGMTVTPTASDINATISVNGTIVASGTASANIPLAVGSNIINVVVTAPDGSTTKNYIITVTRIGSSNADLSNLTLSQGTLTPTFAAATTTYTDSVINSVSGMTVTPSAADTNATIRVNGAIVAGGTASANIPLSVGSNTITVFVTAQDGSTTRTYTITVTRAGSNNADLSNLTVSQGTLTPAFAVATTSYSDNVINSVTGMTVTPSASDINATIRVGGIIVASGTASANIPLTVGSNIINIVVTAQDGSTTRTYTITVTRAGSSNADLSNLTVSQGTLIPAFTAATTIYTDAVVNSVTGMTVTPTAADAGATIRVNGTVVASGTASANIPLTVGSNTINIVITAQDGSTTKTYTITVTRAAATSTNANLSTLTVSQGTLTPVFATATTSYTDSVANSVTGMTVTPSAADTNATIRVNGVINASGTASANIPLAVGSNTINIVVTAQDGSTTRTYTITVTRAASTNADLSNLAVSQGSLIPAFATAVTTYNDNVLNTVTGITVTPTAADTSSTIRVNGVIVASGSASANIPLTVGSNTINVVVTAQDGSTTRTFTIIVSRAGAGNADLGNLTISQGTLTPVFATGTTSYTASVAATVTSMTVTPTASDTNAAVTVNDYTVASGSASQAIALNYGSNTIRVDVRAQDGVTIRTYTITVTRTTPRVVPVQIQAESYDAMLGVGVVATTDSSGTSDAVYLNVGDYMDYAIYVPVTGTYTVQYRYRNSTLLSTRTVQLRLDGSTSALVSTSLAYNTAWGTTTASTGFTLSAGFHSLRAYISAAATSTTDTTLRINWLQINASTAPSNNANLSNLVVSQGALTPAFAAATMNYTDSVANSVTTLTVTPTVAQANATVSVNGRSVTSGSASSPINLEVGTNTIQVRVTAQNSTTTNTYTITVTRAALSTNANLSNLTVSQGALSPAFASGTYSYTDNVAYTAATMTFTPSAADAGSTIRINGTLVASGSASGNIPLNVGNNTITISVIAANGTSNATYTITVIRAAVSTNADLSGLGVSQGALTPVFAAGTFSYSDSVAYTVASLSVTPTAAGVGATITANGSAVASGSPSASIPLNVGSNTITVIVTAQDGSTIRTYTVIVSRAAASNNADLSNLAVSQGTLNPVFAPATLSYTDSVAGGVTSMTVTPTASGPGATITVNGTAVTSGSASQAITLSVGSNTITIIVTAQDGTTTRTYTITVTRAAPSNNANLSNLIVSQGTLTPVFATATTNYTDSVINSVTGMTVTPTAADSTATIRVNGTIVASGAASANIPLAVGNNTINIVVTAQDGTTTRTYTISVTRAASNNANLSNLTVSQGTLYPVFVSGTTSYTESVASTVTSMTVTPTAADSGATIRVNGTVVASGNASQSISLASGNNTITVAITAQDGTTTRTYTITVFRSSYSKMIPPGLIEAENYDTMSGVTRSTTTDSSGVQDLTSLATDDWANYYVNVASAGTYTLQMRTYNSSTSQRVIQLRQGSTTTVIATVNIPASSNWSTQTATATFTLPAGDQTLRLYVYNGNRTTLRANWFQLTRQ